MKQQQTILILISLFLILNIQCFEKLNKGFKFKINSHTLTNSLNAALKLGLPFIDGKCQRIDYEFKDEIGGYEVDLKVDNLCLDKIDIGFFTKNFFVKENPDSKIYFFYFIKFRL